MAEKDKVTYTWETAILRKVYGPVTEQGLGESELPKNGWDYIKPLMWQHLLKEKL
jgi:hypothetical protein